MAAGVFSPLLGVRFLSDDFIWVYEASQAGLLDCFRRGYFEFLRPTSELFWLLGWRLSGADARGYHALLLALHLATAWLLGRWVRETTDQPWAGFAALCLFLSLPTHLEPLYWPAAGGEVLAGAFVLGTLFAYRRWRLQESRPWLAAALVSLVLALGAKESALCVFPGLVLVEVLLVPRCRWQALAPAFLVGGAVLAALALALRGDHGYTLRPDAATLGAWGAYVARAVLTNAGRDALPFADALVPLAVAAAVAATWRRAPAVAMHLAWLPFTVLPYALFVPHLPAQERYLYLSSLAVAGAAGTVPPLALLLAVLGAALLIPGIHRVARLYPLPQPEAVSLEQIGLAPGKPVYVYCPAYVERHPFYACALYGGVPLEDVRPWGGLLQAEPLTTALYWDKFSHRFEDMTAAVREDLREMAKDGRLPVGDLQVLASSEGGRDWAPVGMEALSDGWLRTPGLAGRLASPGFDVPPFVIQQVEVELEFRGPAAATAYLDWHSEGAPDGHRNLEVSAPTTARFSLAPGERPLWWTEGRLRQLVLVPSSEPGEIRLGRITLWGYPRKTTAGSPGDRGTRPGPRPGGPGPGGPASTPP